MPELPEIEISRQRLDPKILSRPIQEITVLDPGPLKGADEGSVREGLVGSAFTGIARFGDFLLLEVAEPSSDGAKGDGAGVLLLALSPSASIEQVRPHEEPPRSTRLGLRFNDGGGLAVVDPRNRSWLSLITDEASAPDLGTFGPDALNGRIDPEHWWHELQGRRAQIKGLLLEPALIAGLGPTYTDEILFQAGIRPDRKASDLTREEADGLREATSATIDKAVRCQARPDQLPKTYLTRARVEGLTTCPKCGGELDKRQVQGRATWFCPTCQS